MTDKMTAPIAVSAAEAARLLGVSKPTVYSLMRREDFPCFKVGTRTLVSVDGLHAWVDQQIQQGSELP